jgi:hypothetical protein
MSVLELNLEKEICRKSRQMPVSPTGKNSACLKLGISVRFGFSSRA